MASRRRDYGSFSPRLQELSAKTTPTDPYQVTDTITIEPPGKKRRDELNDAYARIMAASTKTNAMLRRSDPLPNPPTAPEPLPDDATDEQRAGFEKATAEYEALVETYNGEIRAWNERQDNFDEMAAQVAAESKAASEQYNRALLGPAYDDIVAMSEDWPPELWDAFLQDVNTHFGRGVNPPDDGTCRTCGHVVDEEQAGKATSSST